MIASFLDISSEVEGQGWIDANQNRMMSLAGLLVHDHPGQLVRYKNSRAATTGIALAGSQHVAATKNTPAGQKAMPSSIVAISTGERVSVQNVTDLRDALVDVQQLAVDLVDSRLKVAYARALAIAEATEEIQSKSGTQAKAAQAKAVASSPQVASATETYDQKKTNFDTKLTAVKKKLATPGLIVTRWTTKSKGQASLKLGDILGLGGDFETTMNGFAVFGGLRTTRLNLGKDFGKLRSYYEGGLGLKFPSFPFVRLEPDNEDVRLVTYTIETKHVAYVQDFSSSASLGLRLKASYQQLQNIGATLRELDKVEIAAAFAKVQDLTNMALLSGTKRIEYAAPWLANGTPTGLASYQALQQSYGAAATGNEPQSDPNSGSGDAGETGWRILYAVDVDMEDIQWHFR